MRGWRTSALLWITLGVLAPVWASAGTNAVFSQDGTDVWAVGSSGQVFRSLDGGMAFAKSALGNKALNDVAAAGFTTIVVGDSGKVWRTTDNGGGWSIAVPSGTSILRAVAMPSESVAYAAGDGGKILKSTNGGANWTAQTSGTSNALYALAFSSDDDGWAVGEGGTVLHTTNGGGTWSPIAAGTTNDLFDIDVAGSTVWVVGAFGTARISTNAGGNWSPANLKLDAHSDVRGVSLGKPGTVALVGGGGFVRLSDDDGATWTFPPHQLFGSASDVHFAGDMGFVSNGDTLGVMHSSDGGATWAFPGGTGVGQQWVRKFDVGTTNSKRGATFAFNWQNPRTLYCMIINKVYVSRNEGETWAQIGNAVSGGLLTNAFVVSPKDSNVWVAAVTNPDRVMRTDDSGQTWSTRDTKDFGEYGIPIEMDPDHPDTLFFAPESSATAGGQTTLRRSTDFGNTWAAYSTTAFRSPCDIAVVPESDSAVIIVADGITNVGLGEMSRATNDSRDFTIAQVDPSASEIPGISVSRLRPSRAFRTAWSGSDPKVSNDFGLTWTTVQQLTGVGSTWGTDIARDDPNVVVINRYSGSLSYLSYDGGTTWDGIVKSGANYGMFLRDRGTMFELQSTGIFKLKTTYTYTPGVTQSLSLMTPDGGEVWAAGSTQSITWNATGVALAVIEYRRSSGDPWLPIATVPGYQGAYDWLVPDDPTTTAEVRVRDGWDGSPQDMSSAPFTIAAPRIAVVPNPVDFGPVDQGGEGVQVLTIQNTGTGTLHVTSVSTQTTFFTPSRASVTVPPGSADTLVVLFDPAAVTAYQDTLDLVNDVPGESPLRVPLSGDGAATPSLTLTAPAGGETWMYGTVHMIEWQSVLVDSVKIEYQTTPGNTWTLLENSFPADSGGYAWVIPDDPGATARVRLSQVGGAEADSNTTDFTIAVPRLLASPVVADLGSVPMDQPAQQKFDLSNIGNALVDLSSISSDDPDFTPSLTSLTIGAGQLDSLFVTFDPSTLGPDSAHVTILTNDPGSPHVLLVRGEGAANVDVMGGGPLAFALGQNQPNPFTGRTLISYALPVRTPVTLEVFDLQGHRVATLVDRTQEPGRYTVPFGDGAGGAARFRRVGSGVYFYRLRAGSFVATRKMLLLR